MTHPGGLWTALLFYHDLKTIDKLTKKGYSSLSVF